MKSETPSLPSPAVTNGRLPDILSELFKRRPRVAFPNSFSKLNLPHLTFLSFALSGDITFPSYHFDFLIYC